MAICALRPTHRGQGRAQNASHSSVPPTYSCLLHSKRVHSAVWVQVCTSTLRVGTSALLQFSSPVGPHVPQPTRLRFGSLYRSGP